MGHFHIKDEALASVANAAPGYHRWFVDVADGMPKLRDSAGAVTSLQGPPGPGGSLPTGSGLVEVVSGALVGTARAIGAASATDILSRSDGDARYYALGGALGTPLSGDLSNCTFPILNQSTTGNALTASALQIGRNINGVFFDGTANITIPASADTLTGSTLPALVGTALTALNASNLTSGIVAPVRLGSGSGGSSKFLREDSTFQNIPGGDALVSNPLSQFAATTSAQLAGVISDETGSGALVFATSPTLVTPVLGTPASGNLANCTFPTLNQDTTGYAEALKSATTTVTVSAATAPTAGQVLTAISSTAASWQTPSGGGSSDFIANQVFS